MISLARPVSYKWCKVKKKMKRMYRKNSLLVLALVAFPFTTAAAQELQTGEVLTLHQCMEYAVSHSTKMRLQEADRHDEQWLRRQAVMRVFTPSVDVQTYAYNQYGRNLDPETNTYNTVTTFHNGYSASAGITLFDGFQSINNMKMAATAVKMGVSREQQTRDEICLAILEAYCNVLYYSELETVLEGQISTAKSSRDRAVRQEEVGQKGHADVIQMEAELAQKEYQLVTARNQKTSALITLKDVMFWPAGDVLEIETALPAPQLAPVQSAELSVFAMQSLPAAEIAAMNRKKAALDLKSARGAYAPTLGLYAGWSTTYYTYPGKTDYKAVSFKDQFKNNAGEYLQLTLRIPIFDQFSRRTTLNLKKSAVFRAQVEYDQKMRDIENEVVRAVSDRDGAQAAYSQADRMAEVQEEAYRLSTKQYEVGLISAIEFQTASQAYLNAKAERMNALLQLQIKDAVVRYYQGEPYINQ